MIHTMNDPCDDKVTAAYMAGVIEGASSQPASSTEAAEEQIALLAKTKAETDRKIKALKKAKKEEQKVLAEQLKTIEAEKDALAKAKTDAEAQADNAEAAKEKFEQAKREAASEKKAAEEELSKAEDVKAALQIEKAELEALQTKTEAVTTLESEKKKAEFELAKEKAAAQKLAKEKAGVEAKLAKAQAAAQALADENVTANEALAKAQAAANKALAEKVAANKALAKENAAAQKLAKEKAGVEAKLAKAQAATQALADEKVTANEALVKAQAAAQALADEKVTANEALAKAQAAANKALADEKATANEALVKEKKAAEAKLAEAKEAEEKAEKAQADAQKLAEEKAEAEAKKITEARNKIKSQIPNNTGKDINGDIDFLLNRLKITETVGKNAELDFSKAKEKVGVLQTQLYQATRETENAKEELRSATTKAEDILRSLKAKEVVANVVNTGLQNIVMKKGNAGNTGNTSDTQTGNSSESSESESEEEEGGGDNDNPRDRPPVIGLSTGGVTLEESLSVFQKYGEELIRNNASKQTIVEQLDQLKRTSRLKEKTLQDSLDTLKNERKQEQQTTAETFKKKVEELTKPLRAANKKLSVEKEKIEKAMDVWRAKDTQKNEEFKELKKKFEKLERDYETMQKKFISMKDANTKLIADKKELKTVSQNIVNKEKAKTDAAVKAQQKAEQTKDAAVQKQKKAEQALTNNVNVQNQKLILANTKLETTLTLIRKLVDVNSNEELIDELTEVKRIIDEANRDGADLTFETLPDYIKNYRLLNEKPNMSELPSLTRTLTRIADYLADTFLFNEDFIKRRRIPPKMIKDLANTVTIRNALLKYVKPKNQGAFDTVETTRNGQLLIEYYSANYDKFIEHLKLVCDQAILDDLTAANKYSRFIEYMINFGDTLLKKNKLFTDTQHLDDAKKRFKESKQLVALIKINTELNKKKSDVEGKDNNYRDYDPNFDENQQNRNKEIRLNKILIDKLSSGKIDDKLLREKIKTQLNKKIKTQLEKLKSKLPVATPVDKIPVANSRQDKPIQGINPLDKKKRIPSREGFVRVRF